MRDFKEATREARARLDIEAPSAAEAARVRNAVLGDGSERGSRRLWIAVSCAGAVVAAVLLVLFVAGRGGRVGEGFVVVDGADCVTKVAQGVEVTGSCAAPPHLAMDDAETELAAGSILLREQSELRLKKGRAAFAVNKRKPRQARFVVRVSAGAVVVTGTHFTVIENGQSGSVAVTEGTVEFHWADGAVAPVHAGETLTWPRAQEPAAAIQEPGPVAQAPEDAGADELDESPDDDTPAPTIDKHGKPLPPPDPGVVMRRLLQLRTQNRFDQAIALLRSASRNRGYSAVQRERFGFELCNLVTQTENTAKACSCWRHHKRAFPEADRSTHLPEALHECR